MEHLLPITAWSCASYHRIFLFLSYLQAKSWNVKKIEQALNLLERTCSVATTSVGAYFQVYRRAFARFVRRAVVLRDLRAVFLFA